MMLLRNLYLPTPATGGFQTQSYVSCVFEIIVVSQTHVYYIKNTNMLGKIGAFYNWTLPYSLISRERSMLSRNVRHTEDGFHSWIVYCRNAVNVSLCQFKLSVIYETCRYFILLYSYPLLLCTTRFYCKVWMHFRLCQPFTDLVFKYLIAAKPWILFKNFILFRTF